MNDFYSDDHIKRVVLEGIQYGMRGHVTPVQMMIHRVPEIAVLHLGQKLAVDIRYLFAGKRATKTIKLEVKYPATWWDAFKLRFFPARWRRVNYRVVSQEYEVKGVQLFPEVPIELGQMCVQVDVLERGRNMFLAPEEG